MNIYGECTKNLYLLFKYQNVSNTTMYNIIKFKIKNKMHIEWEIILKNIILPENIITDFRKYINWEYTFKYQKISPKFILDNIEIAKKYLNCIKNNNKLSLNKYASDKLHIDYNIVHIIKDINKFKDVRIHFLPLA